MFVCNVNWPLFCVALCVNEVDVELIWEVRITVVMIMWPSDTTIPR
jgi:hypothetical protein